MSPATQAGSLLHAVTPSPFSTVQDFGRVGWRRYGVTGAGAMDLESHAIANALVGNPVGAATIEFAHGGGGWTISGQFPQGGVQVAVTGGSFAAAIDGRAIPAGESALLRPGARLEIGGARDAVWGYLAVSGGIGVKRELGSRSTYARAGMGGLHGRKIEAGDFLPLQPGDGAGRRLAPVAAPAADAPIRVVLGPQDDYFTAGSIATLLEAEYQVTWQADRMGYRLEGPPLVHCRGFNIVSDAILPGSLQVPGNGRPIALLRDAQTTGGYPKVATIISADLGRFAQKRPLSAVRFAAVTPEAAHLLRREFIARVEATGLRISGVRAG